MEIEKLKIGASLYEYYEDLDVYFVTNLSKYYFEHIKHIENKDKEISEFILNMVDNSASSKIQSKDLYHIAIKIPNSSFSVRKLKGIVQQVTYTSPNLRLNLTLGTIKYDTDQFLEYVSKFNYSRLTILLVYNVRLDSGFEEFK